MLLVFRGIRAFQILLAVATLAEGIMAVVFLKSYVDGTGVIFLPIAALLGLAFLWTFAAALRAPTSFVAVAIPEGRTRIRFAGFVDTVIDNRNIVGARMVRWSFIGGLGVRTNFSGDVALASAWGEAVELTFKSPIRVWLIPRVLPLRAQRLSLSLRNGQKLADHFGGPNLSSPAKASARNMNRRGPRTR